jgi:hypothetical protein
MIGATLFSKLKPRGDAGELPGAEKEQRWSRSAEYNTVLHGFIELINQLYLIGESVCN